MKATIEFTLPDDRADLDLALAACKWRNVVECIASQARTWDKHGHAFKTPDEAVAAFRMLVRDLQVESGLDVYES